MNANPSTKPDRFVIRLETLVDDPISRWWKGLFSDVPRKVDPWLISRAVRHVLTKATMRDVSGRIMVWNEYRVFLTRQDHETLRPLEAQLQLGLTRLLEAELERREADLVGQFSVRLLVDESGDVAPGHVVICPAFANPHEKSESDDEVTIRVGHAQPPGAPKTIPVACETESDLSVRWHSGTARIRQGQIRVLGRDHPNPPPRFIPLTGADTTINSTMLTIESLQEGALIGRPPHANPVHVNQQLLQAGGQLLVDKLPVEISLSHGSLVLTLNQGPMAKQ